MPWAPKRPCRHPGCKELCDKGVYCKRHTKEEAQTYDRFRGTATQRGYDSRWVKARKAFLARNPLCAYCEKAGRLVPATVVDHIIPHRGDKALFWDVSNWQPLCKMCHDKKTFSGM